MLSWYVFCMYGLSKYVKCCSGPIQKCYCSTIFYYWQQKELSVDSFLSNQWICNLARCVHHSLEKVKSIFLGCCCEVACTHFCVGIIPWLWFFTGTKHLSCSVFFFFFISGFICDPPCASTQILFSDDLYSRRWGIQFKPFFCQTVLLCVP